MNILILNMASPNSSKTDRYRFRSASNADGEAVRTLVFTALREFGIEPDCAVTDADIFDIRSHYSDRGGIFDLMFDSSITTHPIVGTVGLFPMEHSRKTVELRKMYLAKEARGQGLGRRLLDRAIAEARRMQFSRMELETSVVLKDAIRMYEKYGFVKCDRVAHATRCELIMGMDL